ncbi:MAG TPA: hypothetical protein VGM84_09995 [Steroidobacteraceae bacterium]|jgi:hypothetical protein
MSRGWLVIALLIALSGCGKTSAPVSNEGADGKPPDMAGVWLPDASRSEPWPAQLPLTPTARSALESFDPAQQDPTTYCMPLGTPRNMLQTEYPLEVVQTPGQLLFVVQPSLANAEVRRVRLDGSALPQAPEASWFGTSRGRWEGATLVVETIGLRPDALISGNGLRHSDELRVIERLSIVNDAAHGRTLVEEIELRDPKAYEQSLKTKRYFSWAPQAQLREPAGCIELEWIDKTWRQRLEEHAGADRKAGKKSK